MATTVALIFGGTIGYLISGSGGMMMGGFILGFLAALATMKTAAKAAKKPPMIRMQSQSSPSSVTPKPTLNVAARLKRLDELRGEGVITALEHETRRAAIIDTL